MWQKSFEEQRNAAGFPIILFHVHDGGFIRQNIHKKNTYHKLQQHKTIFFVCALLHFSHARTMADVRQHARYVYTSYYMNQHSKQELLRIVCAPQMLTHCFVHVHNDDDGWGVHQHVHTVRAAVHKLYKHAYCMYVWYDMTAQTNDLRWWSFWPRVFAGKKKKKS